MTTPRLPALLLACCAALFAACGSGSGSSDAPAPPAPGPQPPPDPPPTTRKIDPEQLRPEKFASCDAYASYLSDTHLRRLTTPFCFLEPWFCATPVDTTAIGIGVPGAPAVFAVSQTNTQEPGVDEGDVVEADSAGNIYALTGNRINVVRGVPADQAQAIATLELPGYATEMLLDETNSRLVVHGFNFDQFTFTGIGNETNVFLVDVSDPAAPVLTDTLKLAGHVLASRRIGNRLHLFTWRYTDLPFDFWSGDGRDLLDQYNVAHNSGDDAQIDAATAALRDGIEQVVSNDINRFLPRLTDTSGNDQHLGCEQLDAPTVPVDPGLTTVFSFDSDGSNAAMSGIVNNAGTVYVSGQNAYLVQSSFGWWWDPAQADETAIYKYAIGAGAPEYQAMGVIEGQARSNLYMSEHNDVLRVAANEMVYDTDAAAFVRSNHLYTLTDDGAGNLNELAAIKDFQTDEDIFAVRFLGDKGYVVTFRQIDPLFTFDLSDPANPMLMGELEMPGFSTYIHPLDEQHLLTIGRDADLDGNIGALALRIFDVADLSAPRLAHSYFIDSGDDPWSAWSPASHDYRAFTYFDGLLAIPLIAYNTDWQDSFNGFAYFSIDTMGGIAEVGRVNHNDLVHDLQCAAPGCDLALTWFNPGPQRAVVIDEDTGRYVHTMSQGGLKVTTDNDPATIITSFTW